MQNLRLNPATGTGILAAFLAGSAALLLAPLFGSNPSFFVALPFACVLLVLMAVNVRWSVALLLMTRVLLDPFLNRTKLEMLGQNTGVGALLNLTVIVLTVFLALRRLSELRRVRHLVIIWSVYLLICAVAVLYSPAPVKALKTFVNLISYPCMALLPFFIASDDASKRAWIKLLLVSSLLPLLAANVGILAGDVHWAAIQLMYPRSARLQGTFTHPNILAFYAVLMIATAFYVLKSGFFRMTFGRRAVLWAYVLNFFAALLATKTRSAWLACWILFVLYGLLRERKYLVLSLLLPPLMLAVPGVHERVADLFSGTGNDPGEKLNSWAWRVRLWRSAVGMVLRRPVLGYGLGSFETLSPDFFDMSRGGTYAHNTYLEVVFETGILGLAAYAMVFVELFKRLWTGARAGVTGCVIAAVYLFTFLVSSLADNMPHYLTLNWYHWFFLGLVLSTTAAETKKTGLSGA